MPRPSFTINIIDGPGSPDHGPNCRCMICPHCGATEVDDCSKPVKEWKFRINAFRVDNQSHCLICDKWFL